MKRPSGVGFVFAIVLFTLGAPAWAQSDPSSWGVHLSFVPAWSVPDNLGPIFGDTVRIDGNDLRVGITRGRVLSGDWSVNYVRKKIADGSLVEIDDEIRVARGIGIDGIAIDKFSSFGTIKRRVQIGLIYGGGIGWAKGSVITRDDNGLRTETEATALLAPMDMELSFVPLGRLELGVAVITTPGLKVRGSYGFNYPGLARFTVGGVYLFGAN